MTSLYKGGNRKDACRYPRCQVRRDLHIIGTDICLLLIANVNIESLCSMKIYESICRETFHAVYYFLLFLAWVKKTLPIFHFTMLAGLIREYISHLGMMYHGLPDALNSDNATLR